MNPVSFADVLEILVLLRDRRADGPGEEQLRFLKFCQAHLGRSHGQFLQDLWVAYELKSRREGFFVEFGAADGVHASNSLYLERELGWRGILAEPARVWREALTRNRRCAIDTRCVWSRTGETVTFNQPAIALHSTIDSYSAADGHAATRVEGERYPVETVSLMDLLRTWDAPARIDYLSLDTEGSELDILQAFDFSAYDVRLITVEHNHTDKRRPLYDLLTANGFVRRFEKLSNVDDWYVKA
jgi:FkbM family methyltransferase